MTKYIVLDAQNSDPAYGLLDDAIVVDIPDGVDPDEFVKSGNYEPTGRVESMPIHEAWISPTDETTSVDSPNFDPYWDQKTKIIE